jgi:hypothetical protein
MAHVIEGRVAYADDLIRVFRQVVGAMLLSWQRVLRAGMVTAFLVWSLAEITGCVVTSSFPPPPVTHLVAVALALALGYGVALTLLAGILLRGGIKFIRQLEGEVEIGAHVAQVFDRRDVGALGATIRRIIDGTRPNFSAPLASARTVDRAMWDRAMRDRAMRRPTEKPRTARVTAPSAAVMAVRLDVARASIRQPRSTSEPLTAVPYNSRPDTRRDPDDVIIRAPAPELPSLPVPASHLPRIEWTYDEVLPPVPRAAAAPFSAPDEPVPSVPVLATTVVPDEGIVEPVERENIRPSDATDEAGKTLDVPGLIPRGWYRPNNSTRPLPAITRPLSVNTQPLTPPDASRVPGGVRSGGLWERLSQALVGQHAPIEPDISEPDKELRQSEPPLAGEVMPEDAWLNG